MVSGQRGGRQCIIMILKTNESHEKSTTRLNKGERGRSFLAHFQFASAGDCMSPCGPLGRAALCLSVCVVFNSAGTMSESRRIGTRLATRAPSDDDNAAERGNSHGRQHKGAGVNISADANETGRLASVVECRPGPIDCQRSQTLASFAWESGKSMNWPFIWPTNSNRPAGPSREFA